MNRSPLDQMVTKHKSALTRAQKSGDPQKIIVACDAAFKDFDLTLWPDNWAVWQQAKDDAEYAVRRSTGSDNPWA